jgi:16S rRNA (cytidine1402-2'-O)-methyltransferase
LGAARRFFGDDRIVTEGSQLAEVIGGQLYVVATPIGNLGDLSPRARAILAQVDRICAEDTRTTGQLLAHFGIDRPLTALHEHNEERVVAGLVQQLQQGRSLALVSDAGTPLISDPGYRLVAAARDAALPVLAVPGPCAAIAALSISGLASDAFVFAGFLPHKSAARRERLRELASEARTLIVYESSHRIEDCLADVAATLGAERRVCLARELSKRFEQSVRLGAAALLDWLKADAHRSRGEFVLVIEGAPAAPRSAFDVETLLRALLRELPPARAARVAAELTGERRNALYSRALALSGEPSGGEEA